MGLVIEIYIVKVGAQSIKRKYVLRNISSHLEAEFRLFKQVCPWLCFSLQEIYLKRKYQAQHKQNNHNKDFSKRNK